MSDPTALKNEILRLTREYSRLVHAGFRPASDALRQPWEPGSTIPYAGRVFAEEEVEAAVSTTLDFWLTLGQAGEAFQIELASFLGVRHSLLVNSGSSANLIAISTLTSSRLQFGGYSLAMSNNCRQASYNSCALSGWCGASVY